METTPYKKSLDAFVEVAEVSAETTREHTPEPISDVSEPCRPAISSMSLGRAWHHDLLPKLQQASNHGFQGVEIFEEDLLDLAAKLNLDPHTSYDERVLLAAQDVSRACARLDLQVVCLQPFRFYEGLRDRAAHAARIAEMQQWIRRAHALGTDLIAIASSFLPPDECTGDDAVLVADMREVAELGAAADPPVRFTFEALCWGTHVDTWERCWDVVRRVDRPNFGICLDSFNIAGRVFADPTRRSGCAVDAGDAMRATLLRMAAQIDVRKLFYVQLVDAERLDAPLDEAHPFHKDGQPPRMSWSRNCRLFYGEEERGAYLPITEIARVVFEELGYRGWVSMELFSRTCAEPDESVPFEHARRGIESWEQLVEDFPEISNDPVRSGQLRPIRLSALEASFVHKERETVVTV